MLGIRYTGSSGVTPQSSLFEEECWCGLGVLGEEVYDGYGVGCVGILGEYLPITEMQWNQKVI